MFENVVAIKINILIVWSWPTMKIVDWQVFKAHKWVTASAAEQPEPAWRAEARGEVCSANSWRPAMWTLKIFDSIWPQEGPGHQATFLFIFNWLFGLSSILSHLIYLFNYFLFFLKQGMLETRRSIFSSDSLMNNANNAIKNLKKDNARRVQRDY